MNFTDDGPFHGRYATEPPEGREDPHGHDDERAPIGRLATALRAEFSDAELADLDKVLRAAEYTAAAVSDIRSSWPLRMVDAITEARTN